jgi:hypothetical protein
VDDRHRRGGETVREPGGDRTDRGDGPGQATAGAIRHDSAVGDAGHEHAIGIDRHALRRIVDDRAQEVDVVRPAVVPAPADPLRVRDHEPVPRRERVPVVPPLDLPGRRPGAVQHDHEWLRCSAGRCAVQPIGARAAGKFEAYDRRERSGLRRRAGGQSRGPDRERNGHRAVPSPHSRSVRLVTEIV